MSDVSQSDHHEHASELMRCAPSRPFPQQHRLGIDGAARLGGIRKNMVITHDPGELGTSLGRATLKSSSASRAFRFGFRQPALVIGQAKFCADEQARVKKLPPDFCWSGARETSAEHANGKVFWVLGEPGGVAVAMRRKRD